MKIKVINNKTKSSQEYKWTGEAYLVGRTDTCHIFINDQEVSSIHGMITVREGKIEYIDLNSTNGSHINNLALSKMQSYILQEGDAIKICDYFISVEDYDNCQSKKNDICWWNQGDLTVECVRIINETPTTKTFVLVGKMPVLFNYQPGQFIILNLEIEGQKIQRPYSISSSPSRPHTIEITVKRVTEGLVSNWLHNNIKVGAKLELSGCYGDFTCGLKPTSKLLFISAGSGITPMMSMSRWLLEAGLDVDIIFIHSASSPDEIIFRQELEMMAMKYHNFHLSVTVTRKKPGQTWLGYSGRLNQAILQLMVPDLGSRTAYICGADGFMATVKTQLQNLGLPMQNYYEESFGGSKIAENQYNTVPVAEPIITSSVVVFAKSGKEIAYDGEEVIQSLANKHGVSIKRSCGSGVCGICKSTILSGEVKYIKEPKALDSSDRKQKLCLTCIAQPVGKVTIDA
ncbi:FHA domain-containing protein [Calothrix sp. PCC 6303]|uniref:FHA domain-containing protein n=1 Tax=Calothrix sp. PCC 6303 TaxID=1170562 RepID=UPI0002A04A61|nr:FHA domain-containing protein [Calothrix sp. PCC 6303]AFZ04357.1 FHA domain containing protein [Calothrix sp. PCC 6303]